LSTVSAVGGLALLLTGIGAAAANHLIPTGHHDAAPQAAANVSGSDFSSPDRSSAGQGSDDVSRSGVRPRLRKTPSSGATSPSAVTPSDRTAPRETTPSDAAAKAALLRTESLQAADTLAKSYARKLQSDTWVLPTSGFHITEWFGDPGPYWATGYHTGIDFATAYGTPVVAVQDARVFQTGWDGPYGNQIRLQLPNGDQVWYNHLSAIGVTKGQHVTKGEVLGHVGETGNAYGYHLHFEYRLAKDLTLAVDPKPFFAAHGIHLP
jgi:murein DD-endopeptidase MepM/ murein hydrolase activator NlpD